MSNKKNDELLKNAVENVSEEELQEIAAAGDTKPETTPTIIVVAGSILLGCKK